MLIVVTFRDCAGGEGETPSQQPAGRRRYFKSNRASFVYLDPFGDSWLWTKRIRGPSWYQTPGWAGRRVFCCRRSKVRFGNICSAAPRRTRTACAARQRQVRTEGSVFFWNS